MRTSVYSIGPGRRLDHHLVALLAAHEGDADRRLVADPAVAGRGLGGADDGERLLALVALDDDLRADADAVAVRLLDDRRVAQLQLERGDAALQERLLLLGVLVLGVLGEVAVELRLVDARSDARPVDGDELVKLGLELLEALGGEVDRLRVHA